MGNKGTLVDFAIDAVCGCIGALAVIFTVHIMVKAGLVNVVIWILLMIPAYLIGERLSRWVKANSTK